MRKYIALLLSILLAFSTVLSASASSIPSSRTDAMDILKQLGAKDPQVVQNDRGLPLGDNLVKNPASRIEFNDSSYAFLNEAGEIIRIKRVSEIREINKQKTAPTSKFESMDNLIEYIEDVLVGSDYELVDKYDFSDDTLSLRYEKILFPGALDQYDYVSVRINKSNVELETYYKKSSGFQISGSKRTISEDKAIAIANEMLGDGDKITDIKLTTVKTNNRFKNDIVEGELRLAYEASSECTIVFVDAYTGEVIGGDIYKVERGSTVGAPELDYASASINLAKNKLEEMGYVTTSRLLSSQFGYDVPNILPRSAFYCCSHGGPRSISSTKAGENEEARYFKAEDVPSGTYKFVFLDACNTYSSYWRDEFNISGISNNKVFLGWTASVGELSAYYFCVDFWDYISSTYTVYEAAQDAADNSTSKPIRVAGDTDYNGYY